MKENRFIAPTPLCCKPKSHQAAPGPLPKPLCSVPIKASMSIKASVPIKASASAQSPLQQLCRDPGVPPAGAEPQRSPFHTNPLEATVTFVT